MSDDMLEPNPAILENSLADKKRCGRLSCECVQARVLLPSSWPIVWG